jgi:hypothetical protein
MANLFRSKSQSKDPVKAICGSKLVSGYTHDEIATIPKIRKPLSYTIFAKKRVNA